MAPGNGPGAHVIALSAPTIALQEAVVKRAAAGQAGLNLASEKGLTPSPIYIYSSASMLVSG